MINIRNNGPKRSVGGFPLEPGDHELTDVEASMMEARDAEAYAELVHAYFVAYGSEAEPVPRWEPAPADVNGDGVVNETDLSIVVTEYNKSKKKATKKRAK